MIMSCSGEDIQSISVPMKMEKGAIIIIGYSMKFEGWNVISGLDFIKNFMEKEIIRIEYNEVIPIERIIKNLVNEKVLEKISVSIIGSLEKNPDIKGIPIRDMEAIPRIEEISGDLDKDVPICRISWYEEL